MNEPYEVAVVGAGVTGAAIVYVMSRYTNVQRVVLLEKYGAVAQVQSSKNNNSQTLHYGDIETNYTLDKARFVKEAAVMSQKYVEKHGEDGKHLFSKYQKMVLAVGREQVADLRKRYEEFKALFPELTPAGRDELVEIEPKIVEGRDPDQEILALWSPNGYAIDYGAMAESLVEQARQNDKQIDVRFNQNIVKIRKDGDVYELVAKGGDTFRARTVMVAASAYSLGFAQDMGHGKDLILMPVAGSFFKSPRKLLKGKVYTMQVKELPFAAVHGDPAVDNADETRWGPTAKPLPMLERYRWDSVWDFVKLVKFRWDAIVALLYQMKQPIIAKFMLHNALYDIPFLGRIAFLKETRKIVPSMKLSDLQYGRRLGGIRPQVVDTKTRQVSLGEAKLMGDNIIFNITPSPGASCCLKNAEIDAQHLVRFLGEGYRFDAEAFASDFKA